LSSSNRTQSFVWHRAGFKLYWTWRSRHKARAGRKPVSRELRELIFRMVAENRTWGAPRIHGELKMLGVDISERTVLRWMRKAPRNPEPAKPWRAFLHNHSEAIAVPMGAGIHICPEGPGFEPCWFNSARSSQTKTLAGSPIIILVSWSYSFWPNPRRKRSSLAAQVPPAHTSKGWNGRATASRNGAP
jgi:hypothetical protein